MILLLSAATLISISIAYLGCLKFTQQFGRKDTILLSPSQAEDLWNRYKSPVSTNSLLGFANMSFLSDENNVGQLLGSFQVRELEVGWPIRFIRGAGIYPDMFQGKDQIQLYGAIILDSSIEFELIPYNVLWFRFVLNVAIHSLWIAILVTITSRLRKRLRTDHELCPNCSYDLHGSREPGCPECGWGREDKNVP